MKYRRVGDSGLIVSTIGLGTMQFGTAIDESTAATMLGMASDAGVNLIDTAVVYGDGASETVLGKVISNRDRWIIASKVGSRNTTGLNKAGLSRRRIVEALDESLQRLATDYIDIYYCHQDDRETALEETIAAMGDLIRLGKIRYFGLSNYAAWRVVQTCLLCARLGVPKPIICQPPYNLLNRTPEVELLPACDHFKIGVAVYSPIARGILTGKYTPNGAVPPDSRVARKDPTMMQTEYRRESLHIAQLVKARARERGLTPAQFAVAWTLGTRQVCCAVAGPRTPEQWKEFLDGSDYALTPEDEAYVDTLVAPGHPSTHQYTDPRYPVTRRLPFQSAYRR